ncbi:MAG TPA: AI-2E family transporter, partial [Pseudonocardia sp.]|nr:AI-2E family transporter [Pseudonocardia sp.]
MHPDRAEPSTGPPRAEPPSNSAAPASIRPDVEAQAEPSAQPSAVLAPSPIPAPLRVAADLSARFLLVVAATWVVVYLLVQIRVVVIPLAIALLIAALLAPVVSAAVEHLRLPKGVATGVVLVGATALFGGVLSFVINAFIAGLPDLQARLVESYQLSIRPLLAGPPLNIPMERLDNLSGELQQSISA